MEPRWHRAGIRKPPNNKPSARVLPKLFAHSQSLFDLLYAARAMPAEEEAARREIIPVEQMSHGSLPPSPPAEEATALALAA
jgi:hypothetical protein